MTKNRAKGGLFNDFTEAEDNTVPRGRAAWPCEFFCGTQNKQEQGALVADVAAYFINLEIFKGL